MHLWQSYANITDMHLWQLQYLQWCLRLLSIPGAFSNVTLFGWIRGDRGGCGCVWWRGANALFGAARFFNLPKRNVFFLKKIPPCWPPLFLFLFFSAWYWSGLIIFIVLLLSFLVAHVVFVPWGYNHRTGAGLDDSNDKVTRLRGEPFDVPNAQEGHPQGQGGCTHSFQAVEICKCSSTS